MPKILAIETATEACSSALLSNGVYHSRFEHTPRTHTQKLLPMIQSIMDESGLAFSDLDAVAFGCGPGAFTGLRIAAGVTQGIALAHDLPVVSVSTLAAIAMQASTIHPHRTDFLICLDARMNEVYWGHYQKTATTVELIVPESVIKPAHVKLPISQDNHFIAAGNGWSAYPEMQELLRSNNTLQSIENLPPSANYICQLAATKFLAGEMIAPEMAQPIYIRDKVADTIKERKNKNG